MEAHGTHPSTDKRSTAAEEMVVLTSWEDLGTDEGTKWQESMFLNLGDVWK